MQINPTMSQYQTQIEEIVGDYAKNLIQYTSRDTQNGLMMNLYINQNGEILSTERLGLYYARSRSDKREVKNTDEKVYRLVCTMKQDGFTVKQEKHDRKEQPLPASLKSEVKYLEHSLNASMMQARATVIGQKMSTWMQQHCNRSRADSELAAQLFSTIPLWFLELSRNFGKGGF